MTFPLENSGYITKSDREKQKEKVKLAKEKTEKDRRGKRLESILGGPVRNDTKDKLE